MEGIRVHTSSPIKTAAAKPSGITPLTATAPVRSSPQVPASNPATFPSRPATGSSSYPVPQPGAPGVPAPTGSVYTLSAYGPLRTRTTTEPATTVSGGPPLPQPRAVPTPHTPPSDRYIPAPPEPGAVPQPPANTRSSPTQPQPSTYPPQFSIPPPTTPASYLGQPHSGTAITTTPSSAYPVPLPVSNPYASMTTASTAHQQEGHRSSLGHPPGYTQNPNAAEPSPSQREAMQQQSTYNFGSAFGSAGRTGSGDQHMGGVLGGTAEEGAWNTVKGWVKAGVEKVGSAEEEVWRRINK